MPGKATIAAIPFGSGAMTGYLLRPAGPVVPRPTAILPAGYDSTAESGSAETAWMVLAHGMNAFTFEGPGQGGMLYADHIPMPPDFETVLAPALDWLLAQDGVDPGKLVLIGRSLAGDLAPRPAATEHRLAALVCDPGQFEFVRRIRKMIGGKGDPAAIWAALAAADPATDAQVDQMAANPAMRDMLAPRMVTLGATGVADFLRKQAAVTPDGRAGRIRCPTLVIDCEGDFASQSDILIAALTCEKKLVRLSAESGAGGHCGGMGQQVWASAVFPWVKTVLGA